MLLGLRLELIWIRKLVLGEEKKANSCDGRNQQKQETEGISFICISICSEEHDYVKEERTEEGANLVEHFLDSVAPSHFLLCGGKRKDCVLGRLFHRLTYPLDTKQNTRPYPAMRSYKGKKWNGYRIYKIADYG